MHGEWAGIARGGMRRERRRRGEKTIIGKGEGVIEGGIALRVGEVAGRGKTGEERGEGWGGGGEVGR